MGGGSGSDSGSGVATDAAGNVYVTGTWQGGTRNNDFDPDPSKTYQLSYSGGRNDIFAVKLAPGAGGSLQLAWAKDIGGKQGQAFGAMPVAVDGAGAAYVTGDFLGSLDFDPGPGTFTLTAPGQDEFVLKLDTSGNFITAAGLGGSITQPRDIAIDGGGNVYTTGYFQSTADFDPTAGTYTLTSHGGEDIFVSRLTQSGSLKALLAPAATAAATPLPGAQPAPAVPAPWVRPPAAPAPTGDALPAWLGWVGPRKRPSALFTDWLANAV
jgi:hypothetical protein